jgi:UDP-glucose 4-epimerase
MSGIILVTGGLGYIGSHTTVELLNAGYEVIIVDNLSNSSIKVLDLIEQITAKRPCFYNVDICNAVDLNIVFTQHKVNAVIHFAALKAVGESVDNPLKYYNNNVIGSIVLFEVMQKHCVTNIVFSSSATVYGDPEIVPIPESAPLHAENPYGHTKVIIEQVLRDIFVANVAHDMNTQIAILRYFNPVGAHPSGLIGESPNGIPNNLMPYITQVAIGRRPCLSIFGNDYPTSDGTGVRDYIHVVDVAIGHVAALTYFKNKRINETNSNDKNELLTVNLGTGIGCSVLEVVQAFERVSGVHILYQFMPRRAGDVAAYYASPDLAYRQLGWRTKYNLDDMCRDAWRFQSQNPNGVI